MHSVQVSKANGPFELVERDTLPEPSATQVRIKVQACGICHGDSVTKEGLFPGIQYPRVPGHEVAGVIDGEGKGDIHLFRSGGAEKMNVPFCAGKCVWLKGARPLVEGDKPMASRR